MGDKKPLEVNPALRQEIFNALGTFYGASKIATNNPGLGERYRRGIEIDCGSEFTVTFAKLKKLSVIFGTDKIDVNSYTHHGGYCETCEYEETRVTLQIYEPTKNIPEGLW